MVSSSLAYMTTSAAFETINNLLKSPDSGLTTSEKRTLYYNLHASLLDADAQDVVDATKALVDAYAEIGVTGVTAVEFGTQSYDNGYFFSPRSHTFCNAKGQPIEADEFTGTDADMLYDSIDEAFVEWVDTSLGYRATATIDLAKSSADYQSS